VDEIYTFVADGTCWKHLAQLPPQRDFRQRWRVSQTPLLAFWYRSHDAYLGRVNAAGLGTG
jgi:hypothetical protein